MTIEIPREHPWSLELESNCYAAVGYILLSVNEIEYLLDELNIRCSRLDGAEKLKLGAEYVGDFANKIKCFLDSFEILSALSKQASQAKALKIALWNTKDVRLRYAHGFASQFIKMQGGILFEISRFRKTGDKDDRNVVLIRERRSDADLQADLQLVKETRDKLRMLFREVLSGVFKGTSLSH